MRAYWFDNLPGDQRRPHDSGNPVSNKYLSDLGIQHYYFPINDIPSSPSSTSSNHSCNTDTANDPIHTESNSITTTSTSSPSSPLSVDALARSRGYTNCDQVTISPATLGDAYESKVRAFFDEHLHEDEEIRYILDGSGYFDVRAQTKSQSQSQFQARASHGNDEEWIRIRLERGDLIIMPAGIYHRFTTDDANYTKAMRLFQDEPKWTPLNKSNDTDENTHRLKYLYQRERAQFL